MNYAHEVLYEDFETMLGVDTVDTQLVRDCLVRLETEGRIAGTPDHYHFPFPYNTESPLCHDLRHVIHAICDQDCSGVSTVSPKDYNASLLPHHYGYIYSIVDSNNPRLEDSPQNLVVHPDLCLVVDEVTQQEGVKKSWNQVVLPIEVKAAETTPVVLQHSVQVLSALQTQECRLYTYSATFQGRNCRLYLWDRSGFMTSETFNFTDNNGLTRLIRIFLRFNQMSLGEHGFDPTAFSVEPQSNQLTPPLKLPIFIRHKATMLTFCLEKRLTSGCDLFGKDTRCWSATFCTSDRIPKTALPASTSVIKESWLPEAANMSTISAACLVLQRQANTQETAQWLHWELTIRHSWSARDDAVEEGDPESLDISDGYEAGLYAYLSAFKIKGLASFRAAEKLESTYVNIRKCHGYGEYLPRIRYRVILDTCGKPLREAKTPHELLSALLDILDGMCDLCLLFESFSFHDWCAAHEDLCRRGILHRDISDNNCLMRCDNGKGFLTDLDLAISLQRKALLEASGRHHRTVRLSLLFS